MAFGQLSVKGRALRYLAQREHSRHELQAKLRRHVQDTPEASAQSQIDAALDDLASHGLLSDARAAASVLRTQGPRSGARRLKQTLQAKGLAADLVTSTLAQARSTELSRAQAVWQRRYGQPAATPQERAKQMRFLAGRGFEGDVIRRVLQGGSADDESGGVGWAANSDPDV
jgi:regulatory protein